MKGNLVSYSQKFSKQFAYLSQATLILPSLRRTGQIGYAIVPMIARGVMLGPDQPVILHMLDIEPAAEALNGVRMELIDAAFPLLKGMFLVKSCLSLGDKLLWVLNFVYYAQAGVVATTDAVEACKGVNIAVMVGGFPRKEGMERKDVMSKNVSIYKAQASALEKHAAPDCKVRSLQNTSYIYFLKIYKSVYHHIWIVFHLHHPSTPPPPSYNLVPSVCLPHLRLFLF